MANTNIIADNIFSEGIIADKVEDRNSIGVFAYLIEPATTIIAEGGTFQKVVGTFGNGPIENFTGNTDYIIYTGPDTDYFEIDWNVGLECDNAGKTVSFGVSVDGEVITNSSPGTMSGFLKYADEIVSLSGTVVVELSTNSTVQLQITSTTTADEITIDHLTTTIRRFFK